MASVLPSSFDLSLTDHHEMIADASADSLLLQMDDFFPEVLSSLDDLNIPPAEPAPEVPMAVFSDVLVPNPLAAPVSPSPSTSDLVIDAEPTKLSEMKFTSTPATSAALKKPHPRPIKSTPKKKKTVVKKKVIRKVSVTLPAVATTTPAAVASQKKPTPSASISSSITAISPEDDEVIQQERRERNREHAKRSRQRRKALTTDMEHAISQLKAENDKLRTQIYEIIDRKKADQLVDARLTSASDKFVQALQKPSNRVCDATTLRFLKSLRKNIMMNNPASIVA